MAPSSCMQASTNIMKYLLSSPVPHWVALMDSTRLSVMTTQMILRLLMHSALCMDTMVSWCIVVLADVVFIERSVFNVDFRWWGVRGCLHKSS